MDHPSPPGRVAQSDARLLAELRRSVWSQPGPAPGECVLIVDDKLHFEPWNLLHVPVAGASMAMVPLWVLAAWRRRDLADLASLALTIRLALVANAFVCGVLSGPNDRYGAWLVRIATLLLVVALARLMPAVKKAERGTFE